MGPWSNMSIWSNTSLWTNMSLWANIGNDMTAENLAGQMTGLLNSVLPLILGQQGIMPFPLPSPEVFSDILPVLIQILAQQANQSSWDKLEGMLGALLSTLRDTPVWDSVPPAVSVMSQVMGALVNNMQAETAFILSFQKPLTVLMSEIVQAVNGSDFNMADVSDGMPSAIELTVEAAIQAANRSTALECRQVLKAWEPVREAAGLSEASLGLWCNISLLPVMEAYAASNYVYATPNMTGMGMGHGTGSVDTTAAVIVAALRSFYWVQVNRTIVTEQLGAMLFNTLYHLQGLNMTAEDQAHWNAQFLQLQLSQSTQGLRMSLEQLDALAMDNPWMRPYLLAVEMTLNYTLENSHLLQNTTSAQHLLMEALEMLLTGSNLTQDSIQAILTENIFSRPDGGSINKLLKDMVRELVRVQLLGDWPMVYGVMEQFLSTNATNLILEKAIEFSGWWGSSTASGFDLVTQALPRMYEVVKAFLSTLRQMSVPFPPISEMFVELAEHVITMLRQVSQTSDIFTPLDYYLSQLQGEMTGQSRSPFPRHHEGVSRRVRRELMREEPMKEPMDDFLDLFYLDYPVLFQALAMPPTMPDIMETAHMFFGNPDLSVVLKGVSRDMGMVPPPLPPMGNVSRSMSRAMAGAVTWGPSVSPPLEDPIDVALGILSYLTLPRQWQAYGQLFMEIANEDWIMEDLAKIQKLSAGLGKMVDLAMVLSQHPPLQVAQRVEHMVRQLSAEVARIIYSGSNNGSNKAVQFLTAFNDILADNLEEVSDITSQINAIIQNILSSLSRPEAYMSLDPYVMALDQTIVALTSYLPTDSLMYLNTSGQMVKDFALLVAHPRDMKKMLKATSMLSASLDHLLASVRETALPGGKPIQSITHPLLLNSALATHTLFNLSAASHNFSSPQEKEAMINQTFLALVAFLPEDQRMCVLPLEPVLLAALSGVSNTAQIPPAFLGISKQVTLSILTMLNLTNTPTGYQGASAGAMVQGLFGVSQQVSTSLWEGLSMSGSAVHVPAVLASLNQAAMAVAPLMPDGGEHYFNVSLHILHITAMAINYTATTGDIAGATAVISSSVQSLLVSLSSYPSLQTTGSIIGDLEHAIQKMLQVLQSGRGPLAQTADITQLLLHNVQGLLGLANTSMEASVARLVLAAAKMNTGHLLMMNETNWTHKLSMVLTDISNRVPEDIPCAPLIKNITMGLATESQESLHLLLQTIQLGSELFNSSWSDGNFSNILVHLTSNVCTLEDMGSIQQLMQALSLGPGFLCETAMPILQAFHIMTRSLFQDSSDLYEALFETFVGDPNTYNVNTNWTSVLTQALGLNISSLKTLNINMTSPVVKMSELLRNKTAFALAVQRHTDIPPEILHLLMETTMPNRNFQMLAWLANMHHCRDPTSLQMNSTEQLLFQVFCNLPTNQWYNFVVIVARYIHMENVIYKLMLSSEMQSVVGFMLQMVKFLTDMMSKLLPAVGRLQDYMFSIRDLNLVSDPEFRSMVHGKTRSMSSRATFTTVSRAMCNHGIMSLFGISKLPIMTETDPSTQQEHRVEELVNKFKIPRNATPFCMNFYLDMVNTTGGAIAWAFLKPMLLGQVLYSPDTPLTRAIIKKSNATMQQFANLKMYSQDWLQSSSYIMDSAKILNQTLPMLQNSLGNSFVQNFIEMQTDIDVSKMKDTLKNFSSTTTLLEKNKDIVTQITTLSNLMINLSSCINFDRFHGINSTDDLNTMAEHLTQTRDLYASIIFKLPKDDDDSHRKRRDTSGSSSSALPPKVDYTIRMSIENAMRTDRSRNPFWVKDPYISSLKTQRYNRGFVYLQESIDRAIIETQTGQQVTEPAVQLQAFPYPCFLKDEYLNSIAFAFPLVLMIAWVLFIANFVKKLVHERELRLHEYMKMMGVNPISHFFAWFIESACFLIITIIILTIILKAGRVLPHSDSFLLFLYLSDYGLSILAISFLVSSFFDKTNIAGLSGALIYVISFFPFIVVMSLESSLSFSAKSALSLFAPTCFSYASQYISRYESQGEGIQWSNQYISPLAGDTSSFGWLCWLLLIDSVCYFIIGAYIRIVFPGKYGIAKPWYFPVMPSFWADLFCCCSKVPEKVNRGLLFSNIIRNNLSVFPNEKDNKAKGGFPSHMEEEISGLPVGVALHGLTKTYGDRAAIENLNVKFYEGQVTALLGHNGAGKTTTMSLLTGLFAPSSGTIEVYGKDMETNIDDIRRELGVCMQYDVHFDHLTTKEHLLLYGQIKAPHWSQMELKEQVRKILEETGMYAHRHKRVGTLSGGMKRKLSISIAFIGGSRLVVLDEPTTGVDPCSRRSIWDIVIKHKKDHTIILSTHHLDEAEVLSDRIAFLERGGLKCCGSPFYLKDKLAQGYNLTLTKKVQAPDSQARFDGVEVKTFIQSYMPDARLKETELGDLVYSLPPFSSSNAEAYRSLLSSLDSNLDLLQLGCYGISDTTLEEVFLQLTQDETEPAEDKPYSVSESMLDLSASRDSLPEDLQSNSSFGDKASLTGSSTVHGLALTWQQVTAMLMKRVHHSRRDWKGLFSQVVLPVLFIILAMGLGSIKSDLQHFPEMELSPALYHLGPQYSFFSNQNPNSSNLVNTMMSFPGIDNGCLNSPGKPLCTRSTKSDSWETKGDSSVPFESCKCTKYQQVCQNNQYQPPHKMNPSSQIVYNLTGINVENYLLATANNYIRNRYGGFVFGEPLPTSLQMDLLEVPVNRTLSKVWYNPEGHHTMPAYLNSLNNFILRTSLPAGKDPQNYAITVSSHPYPGEVQEEDAMVQGLVHILVAMCALTGYSIMTASFVIYEVQEHHSGSKRLQHISGIGEPFYWVINFFYDMALYMLPVALSIAAIAAFQLPAFNDRQNLAAVSLLLVMFGFATFPWMYLLSGVFKDAEMAFISYVCINLFISTNTIISTSVVFFLGQLNENDERIHEVYRILSNVFLIFPQFSFGNGLMELARVEMQVQILSVYGVDAYKNPFAMDMLGWMFVSLFLQGFIGFTLRLLLNKWLIRKVRILIFPKKAVPQSDTQDEDEDVVAECQRVTSGAAVTDLLQVNQLTKVYQHLAKKIQAVKRLSVGIPAGECFGLLGVNGAGKTTTFKMLTGDISPTEGTAQIKDWDGRMVDIIDCRNEGINIGYCPQVDALDDLLTGEEHLYFYARIRGISKREIDRVVNYLLKKLELGYHRHTISDSYSCGTRRKLSTALALIGHPHILLLDEPSSGMDPRSKRHLWKIISEEVKGKCAVVLTSHSMEECEALCTRLAIMVKGQFRCLGSLQHIKNKFGSGFTVKMYLAVSSCDVEVITNFMQHHFPSTYLKDQHSSMVEYHVPVAPGGVADIFDQLESNKAALQIKHFSVSQTTLDEVFINFAMGKIGIETIPIHSEEDSEADSISLESIAASET
ncbi:glucosylceramide transporter ABCA12 isoform X2 [Coregonus clupeaformis]|uniref:glucosylceramide transporter ABCA12 isoform X2 n=1 Tax=Coregonus clupeaformis TaxID=59861 RepID=UPI001E1C5A2D|nr:glucosylceramide transporter ABCA12 isoform X2 [Coregonus clupeaformis]